MARQCQGIYILEEKNLKILKTKGKTEKEKEKRMKRT